VSGTQSAESADLSQLFTRQASGLVRVAGSFDTFIFCIGVISVGAAIFAGFFYHVNYPGASFALATVIAGIGGVFIALCFYFWSVIFPRSGGTFVFLSRTIGPGLAFPITFFEAVGVIFFAALNAMFIVQVGVAPLFSTIGSMTHSNVNGIVTWLSGHTGTFIVGTVVLLSTGLIPLLGMRSFLTLQRAMFAVAVVGIVLGAFVLIFQSRSGFDSKLLHGTGLTREGVLAAAAKTHMPTASFSWSETLKFTVWPAGYLFAAVLSSGIGGEIKAVRRSQFVGMVGSVVVATIAILIYIPLSYKVFGGTFMDALVWNSTAAPHASTVAPPYITNLIAIASSPVVGTIVILGFIAWLYFLVTPELVYSQRLMVAWSFDRIAPDALGYVSRRYHSPVVAIAMSLTLAVAFLALITYGVLAVLAFILGIFTVWAIVALAGAAFPWVRRDIYRESPINRYRIGRFPIMPLVCVPAAGFLIWQVVFYWRDPLVAGHSTATLVAHGVCFAAGVVLYLMMRIIRREQGVDLAKTFTELPIE
jgi:amino acid transporter